MSTGRHSTLDVGARIVACSVQQKLPTSRVSWTPLEVVSRWLHADHVTTPPSVSVMWNVDPVDVICFLSLFDRRP